MKFCRSLFLSLVVVVVAGAALGGENGPAAQSQNQQTTAAAGDVFTMLIPTPFGSFAVSPDAQIPSRRIVLVFPAITDVGCLKLRMYKVKPTERLAEGETATRGYTTCELARNYQMRTAVAHPRNAKILTGNAREK